MKKRSDVAWLHSPPPPPSFSNCIGNAGYTPSHATSIFTTYPTPERHTTRPRELATDSRGAGPEGPFDQYVTRQTSKPVIVSKMGRTIISTDASTAQGGPGAPYDRASPDACTRHDLQARSQDPLLSEDHAREVRRKTVAKRGQHPEKTLARTRGKGTTSGIRRPSRPSIMAI